MLTRRQNQRQFARLSTDVAVAVGSKAILGVVAMACHPVFARLLGLEAYGLVGLFTTLTTIMFLFDLGLSATLNRAAAQLIDRNDDAGRIELRDTVWTFELPYWGLGLVSGGVIAVAARPIAERWLNPDSLSAETIINSIRIMGLAIALNWPAMLYGCALNGTRRQVFANITYAVTGSIKQIGSIVVLIYGTPSPILFFTWQAVCAAAQAGIMRVGVFGWIGAGHWGSFDATLLKKHSKFAFGMAGVTLVSMVITQTDRLVVSRVLSLESLGRYTLAVAIGTSLFYVITPVTQSLFPRFTQLAKSNDQKGITQLYHTATQTLSVLLFPTAVTICFFRDALLFTWTGNAATASSIATATMILCLSTTIAGIGEVLLSLQLAEAWTALPFWSRLLTIAFQVPAIFLATRRWGITGAATATLTINALALAITVHLTHRRLMRTEKWTWYATDIGYPLIATIATVLVCVHVFPVVSGRWMGALPAVAAGGLALVSATFATSRGRCFLRRIIDRSRRSLPRCSANES